MNDGLQVRVLHALAGLNEEFEALPDVEPCADRNTP